MGIWKNYDELEEEMTVDELNLTLEAMREQEWENRKFTAALKGVDLGKLRGNDQNRFEQVKQRALAKASGKSEAEAEFAGLGFGVDVEDED